MENQPTTCQVPSSNEKTGKKWVDQWTKTQDEEEEEEEEEAEQLKRFGGID